jgi:hypothetical protein
MSMYVYIIAYFCDSVHESICIFLFVYIRISILFMFQCMNVFKCPCLCTCLLISFCFGACAYMRVFACVYSPMRG